MINMYICKNIINIVLITYNFNFICTFNSLNNAVKMQLITSTTPKIFDNNIDKNQLIRQVNRRPINPIPPPLLLSTNEFSAADFAAISADPFGNLEDNSTLMSTSNVENPFSCDESLQPRTARLRQLEILEEVFFILTIFDLKTFLTFFLFFFNSNCKTTPNMCLYN